MVRDVFRTFDSLTLGIILKRTPPGARPNGIRIGLPFGERFFRWPQPPDIARFPAPRIFFRATPCQAVRDSYAVLEFPGVAPWIRESPT